MLETSGESRDAEFVEFARNKPAAGLLRLGVVLAGFGLLAVTVALNAEFYHDDSYIVLRYARNWLAGRGLVWNPGEYVQGYSNFLYLVLLTGPASLGLDWVASSRLVSAVAFSAVVLLAAAFPRWTGGRDTPHPLAALPPFWVLSSVPLAVWTLGGLEGSLFALWAALGASCFLRALAETADGGVGPAGAASGSGRSMWASGLCFGLGTLTRPDGFVFALASLLFLVARRAPDWRAQALRLAGAFVVVLVPYLIWTTHYYGDPLPNTYYVKVAGSWLDRLEGGLGYSFRFFVAPPFGLATASVLLAATLGLRGARAISLEAIYLGWLILAYVAAISFVGGDHMASFRLFLPLVPLNALLCFLLLRDLLPRPRAAVAAGVYALAFVLASSQFLSGALNPRGADAATVIGGSVARYINRCWPPGSTVALNTAGSTPYFADDYRYIDMLGLNDRTIAKRRITRFALDWQKVPGHAKGDGRYVLSREPEFIIIGPASGDVIDRPWFLSDFEMARDPSFRKRYTLRQIPLALEGGAESAAVDERRFLFRYYQRADRPEIACAPAS